MSLEEAFPDSPFEPTRPVSPRKFKGRLKDTQKILRQIPRVIRDGMPEHFFITGKKEWVKHHLYGMLQIKLKIIIK